MTDDLRTDRAGSSGGAISRSAIGRVTGALSRRLISASGLKATGRFLRRQVWAWPIIAAVVLGVAGWWVYHFVKRAMRQQRATDLNTMVDASVSALRVWMGEQRINPSTTVANLPGWRPFGRREGSL